MLHFHPHGESRPCWNCEHWGGWDSSGAYAVCLYDNHVSIKQSPKDGCAMWVRATGADDDVELVRTGDWKLYTKPE